MNTNWLPLTRSAQLAMAKRWLDLLPSKEQDWRIPEGMTQRCMSSHTKDICSCPTDTSLKQVPYGNEQYNYGTPGNRR
jgi:hypothetical protein